MIPNIPVALTDQKLQLIEELGVLHEQHGMQPAAGRVLALLLVSDQTELTFEEICETLNLSKSATSNALNFLLSTSKIEYITHPGERRRYFRCKLQSLKEGVQRSLTSMGAFSLVLRKVLAQRSANSEEFNKNFEEAIDFLDFMRAEIPALFQKWEDRKK